MRVTYLHQYFVPPDGPGGTRSYEFARRLVNSGHHVHIITSSAALPPKYLNDRLVHRMEIEGIPLTVIRVPYSNSMPFWQRILAFITFAFLATFQAVRQPADVIFATSTPLTIAIPAIITKLWQRKSMVLEVRDLWPEIPIAVGALQNPILRWLAQGLEWLAYRFSEHIICLSPGMAAGIQKRGISEKHITIIPNSCDLDLFSTSKISGETIRQSLQIEPHHILVVYTGTFGIINGVDYLVRVAAEAREKDWGLKFLLIGSGKKREEVRQLAEELGVLGCNLWIWDQVPKREMPQVLAAADIATSVIIPLPSLWHNSANKFFDALAAGKPVAINHLGWQAELLTEHGAGLVLPPDDPAVAARILHDAAQNTDWLENASQAAHNLAKTQFDRDELYKRFERVLLNALRQ